MYSTSCTEKFHKVISNKNVSERNVLSVPDFYFRNDWSFFLLLIKSGAGILRAMFVLSSRASSRNTW